MASQTPEQVVNRTEWIWVGEKVYPVGVSYRTSNDMLCHKNGECVATAEGVLIRAPRPWCYSQRTCRDNRTAALSPSGERVRFLARRIGEVEWREATAIAPVKTSRPRELFEAMLRNDVILVGVYPSNTGIIGHIDVYYAPKTLESKIHEIVAKWWYG
jgi:hypothetical protein